jgi:transcriptional regulator with XRE-family HTH domain
VIVSRLIRHTRQRRGWSTADLAKAAGVSTYFVEHLEAGRGGENLEHVVKAVLDALGITPAVMWRHAMAEANSTFGPVEFGWSPLYLDVVVVAGPVEDASALDRELGDATIDGQPPGLIVIRTPRAWAEGGESAALEVAAELSGFQDPSYQVRTSDAMAVLWDPSLIVLTHWDDALGRARVRVPAGTTLTLTTTEEAPSGGATLVVPTTADPRAAQAGLRALSSTVWATPLLHDVLVPGSLAHRRTTTSARFILPLMEGGLSWN